LTGHLILSSVHANDAATTIARLIDLKVEPFPDRHFACRRGGAKNGAPRLSDCGRLLEAPLSEQLAYEKATGEKRTEFQYVLVVSLAHIPVILAEPVFLRFSR